MNSIQKEIVVNSCWGGFGLSPFATVEYYKLENKISDVFLYVRKKEYFSTLYETEYVLTDLKNVDKNVYDFCISEIYQGDIVQFKDLNGTMNWDISKFLYYDRENKNLISVIKKYGEKCNKNHSQLEICNITIPNGYHYYIDEYDGMEEIVIEKNID